MLGLMRGEPLPAVAGSGAIVLVDVCHSSRMFQEHEYLDTDRLRGFPELFLGHGAKGLIATTGWVDDEFAGKLAQWLLEAAGGQGRSFDLQGIVRVASKGLAGLTR